VLSAHRRATRFGRSSHKGYRSSSPRTLPLAVVIAYSEILLESMPSGNPSRERRFCAIDWLSELRREVGLYAEAGGMLGERSAALL
jgi:hypothetical protein